MPLKSLLRRRLQRGPANGALGKVDYRLDDTRVRLAAVGDIHGRADLLQMMFDRFDALERQDGVPIVEIYLGDYIDRGPDSALVLELLRRRKAARPHVQTIAGNHEEMLVRALEDVKHFPSWLENGGRATLASYGVALGGGQEEPDILRAALRAAIPAEHLRFLGELTANFWYENFFFVHAGVRPGVPLLRQNPVELRWIREPFLSSREDFGAIVIHGHTPSPVPQFRWNRACVDTGAFHTGRLTSLLIGADGARVLEVSR